MKKLIFACLYIILAPLTSEADIIFFKDGMRTVCQGRAWEEHGEIKCEYSGAILSYQKKDVLRIEKRTIEKQVKLQPKKRQPLRKTGKKAVTKSNRNLKSGGLEFYNPRRSSKYWTSQTSKHNTFKDAISALAKQYDRSPQWVQKHMGNTNDLGEIHRNLATNTFNVSDQTNTTGSEKIPEILFYNPRRPHKYWTSQTSKHDTFKEAISALSKQYGRPPQWVQEHMGNTNNLDEIHQNLANSQLTESP